MDGRRSPSRVVDTKRASQVSVESAGGVPLRTIMSSTRLMRVNHWAKLAYPIGKNLVKPLAAYVTSLLRHQRFLKVRMKIWPLEITIDELEPSPAPSEFVARSSNFGFAAITSVSPFFISK